MGAGTGTMFWPLGSGAGCQRRAGPTRTIGITARSRPSRGGTHAASTRGGGGGGRRGAGPGLMAFRAVPGPAASRFGQSAWDKWELTSNWQWHPGSRLEMIPFPTRGGWWRRWGRGRVGVGNQRPWEGWVGGDVVNSPWWSEDGRWKNWNGENALGLVSRAARQRGSVLPLPASASSCPVPAGACPCCGLRPSAAFHPSASRRPQATGLAVRRTPGCLSSILSPDSRPKHQTRLHLQWQLMPVSDDLDWLPCRSDPAQLMGRLGRIFSSLFPRHWSLHSRCLFYFL